MAGLFRIDQRRVVISSIIALNLPLVVSKSIPPNFEYVQYLKLRSSSLDKHWSFSLRNVADGRYYTLLSSQFHHEDWSHFLNNIIQFIPHAEHVSCRMGSLRLLQIYLCGGVAGNLLMWLQCIQQKSNWSRIYPTIGNIWMVGPTLNTLKETTLSAIHSTVNEQRLIIGASAAICAVQAVSSCLSMEYIYKNFRNSNSYEIADQKWNLFPLHCINCIFFGMLFTNECLAYRSNLLSSTSFNDGVFAFSKDGIAHAGHLGGCLFGVVFYVVQRYCTQL